MEDKEVVGISFGMHSVYVSDMSFEVPNAPRIFTVNMQPKVDFDLNIKYNKLNDELYESKLIAVIKVNLMPGENDTENTEPMLAYMLELTQAGIVSCNADITPEALEFTMDVVAPSVLFPYLRQNVSNIVTNGGFQQLLLPLVNFEHMFRQKKEQAQAQA